MTNEEIKKLHLELKLKAEKQIQEEFKPQKDTIEYYLRKNAKWTNECFRKRR